MFIFGDTLARAKVFASKEDFKEWYTTTSDVYYGSSLYEITEGSEDIKEVYSFKNENGVYFLVDGTEKIFQTQKDAEKWEQVEAERRKRADRLVKLEAMSLDELLIEMVRDHPEDTHYIENDISLFRQENLDAAWVFYKKKIEMKVESFDDSRWKGREIQVTLSHSGYFTERSRKYLYNIKLGWRLSSEMNPQDKDYQAKCQKIALERCPDGVSLYCDDKGFPDLVKFMKHEKDY